MTLHHKALLCAAFLIVLTAAPLVAAEPSTDVFRTIVRKPGDDGSKAYRIPGLATTPSGTLLAVFDIRHDGPGDLPGNIDVGAMRSTDDGESWSSMQRVLDFDGSAPNSRGNGVGNPAILVDRETGVVFVAALWSQGDRGWNGSGPGMKPDETGQLVLAKSTDDGATWSKPVNITAQVKDPAWRLCFQGPGARIQTKDGTLIFAAQFRNAGGAPHSCFIYSRDHGDTWTISPPAIPGNPPTSEAQIAELADGSLLLTMRNESRAGTRAWARWEWSAAQGEDPSQRAEQQNARPGQWSQPRFTVPDPTCMAGLIRHPTGTLLFSNPNSSTKGVALTIRASDDGGLAWSDGQLLDPRGCMYSCMTILNDGRIGILYEVEGTLTFAGFPLSWVEGARQLSLGLPFVGRRLALWALDMCYGAKAPFSGPLAKSVDREGTALVVRFDHAAGGLRPVQGSVARGFEVAAADGVFYPAQARLEGDVAWVTTEQTTEPAAVRYGWQPFSAGNLANSDGLPASTFQLSRPALPKKPVGAVSDRDYASPLRNML